MKEIHIFLASSIVEFEKERVILGDFIRSLNDIYVSQGLYFYLDKCEDISKAVGETRKQNEYNNKIENADLFYVLFGKKAPGDYTLEEFETARKSFKEKHTPRIITFFKKVNEEAEISEEVKKFMQYLDIELKHFYSIYRDIDTVKLNILLELARDNSNFLNLKIKDGTVTDDSGKISVDITKNPFYANCSDLRNLRENLEKTELQLEKARINLLETFTQEEFEKAMELGMQKTELENQFSSVEKALLEAASRIAEITSEGEVLTQRAVEAIRLFEQGNTEEALRILDDDQRKKDLKHIDDIYESVEKEYNAYLNELSLKIRIASTKIMDSEQEEYIISLYKEGMQVVLRRNMETEFPRNYLGFLRTQKKVPLLKEVLKKLDAWEQIQESIKADGVYQMEKAECLETCGRYEEAIKILEKEIRDKTLKCEDKKDKWVLLKALKCISVIYFNLEEYKKSKGYLETYIKMTEEFGLPIDGMTYIQMGGIYTYCGEYKKAELCYEKAKKAEILEEEIDILYNNEGFLFEQQKDYENAWKCHEKALEIREERYRKNPGAERRNLLISYLNLANVCVKNGENEKAIHILDKAEKIGMDIRDESLEALKIRGSFYNVRGVVERYNDKKAAVHWFLKSIDVIKRMEKMEGEGVYELGMITALTNLMEVYWATGECEKSEKAEEESNRRLEKLLSEKPGNYEKFAVEMLGENCAFMAVNSRYDSLKKYEEKLLKLVEGSEDCFGIGIQKYKLSYYYHMAQEWKTAAKEQKSRKIYEYIKEYDERAMEVLEKMENREEFRALEGELNMELQMLWIVETLMDKKNI